MMAMMGETMIFELDRDRIMASQEKEREEMTNSKMSKLILMPDNFWKMHFDNQMIFVLIVWLFLVPIKVCQAQYMSNEDVQMLLAFDIIFILDRLQDLFVTFYNPNG